MQAPSSPAKPSSPQQATATNPQQPPSLKLAGLATHEVAPEPSRDAEHREVSPHKPAAAHPRQDTGYGTGGSGGGLWESFGVSAEDADGGGGGAWQPFGNEGDGGNVEAAISGGAPLGVRLGHFYRGAGVTVLEGYGLTETTAGATLNLIGAHRVGSVGRPIPGTSVKIAEDGEVLLRGPIVMEGYWQNQAANDEVFDSERWFKSGDLGKLDDDGFLYIVGRKKELIVTAGGKNVAPAVLEDRLRAHPKRQGLGLGRG